jgi:hypothetical protein
MKKKIDKNKRRVSLILPKHVFRILYDSAQRNRRSMNFMAETMIKAWVDPNGEQSPGVEERETQ